MIDLKASLKSTLIEHQQVRAPLGTSFCYGVDHSNMRVGVAMGRAALEGQPSRRRTVPVLQQ